MNDLRKLIEEYIAQKVKGTAEREHVGHLLLIELKPQLDEVQLPYEISIQSLQAREAYRQKLADAFYSLLTATTNSKELTQQRIVAFTEYLKKYEVELVLDEVFKREAMNPYERMVDLLKTLHEGKTKESLMEYYSISRKPLEKDINELVMGTRILGQKVKIRDIQREQKKMTYQSTVHPVFLPLNLTEVYCLIIGLKSLSDRQEPMMSKMYDHLANRIYCQLSEYARKKINKKERTMNFKFPTEDEFERYNGSIDEQEMADCDYMNTLMYLFKAGIKCTIRMNNNDMEVIKDCYIGYDVRTNEIFIKDSRRGERKRNLDVSQILDIQYEYT